jgi:hypothetical protein
MHTCRCEKCRNQRKLRKLSDSCFLLQDSRSRRNANTSSVLYETVLYFRKSGWLARNQVAVPESKAYGGRPQIVTSSKGAGVATVASSHHTHQARKSTSLEANGLPMPYIPTRSNTLLNRRLQRESVRMQGVPRNGLLVLRANQFLSRSTPIGVHPRAAFLPVDRGCLMPPS